MDAIHLNNFSLEILDYDGPVEKVIYKDSNYYAMPDRTEYRLRLTNSHDTIVDAHVWIDGLKIGIWRINPYSRIVIERPSGVSRRFILLKEGTYNTSAKDNGVVRVTFRPQMRDNKNGPMRHGLEKEYLYSASVPLCTAYSDTVTPYAKQHQNCMMSTREYENKLYGSYGSYGSNYYYDDYGDNGNRSNNSSYGSYGANRIRLGEHSQQQFDQVTPLIDIDYDNITTMYTRLVVDNDRSTYSRKFNTLREARNVSGRPPRLDLQHPSRPHPCTRDSGFKLSKKYYYDTY